LGPPPAGPQAHQLADGLAHGAGVVGEALDVLEGLVDDVVGAGVAVHVAAGQPLEAGVVGDAALAVGQLGPQGQGARQRAAAQAARPAGAQLGGRPGWGGVGVDMALLKRQPIPVGLCKCNVNVYLSVSA